jgi:hypothetical protein
MSNNKLSIEHYLYMFFNGYFLILMMLELSCHVVMCIIPPLNLNIYEDEQQQAKH